jgi:hypothetical protein
MGFSTGFQILVLIHILAAFVAFGGNFVQPSLARAGAGDEALAKVNLYIQLPAMVILWVAGMGALGMSKPGGASEPIYSVSQTWALVALVVWLIALVLQFLVGRAYQNGKKDMVPAFNGILHVCLIVALYLMVFRPGAPGA